MICPPRATAIWTPGTVGSMHQCQPWLPLHVFWHPLHATGLRVFWEGVLRSCCSTTPVSHNPFNSHSLD